MEHCLAPLLKRGGTCSLLVFGPYLKGAGLCTLYCFMNSGSQEDKPCICPAKLGTSSCFGLEKAGFTVLGQISRTKHSVCTPPPLSNSSKASSCTFSQGLKELTHGAMVDINMAFWQGYVLANHWAQTPSRIPGGEGVRQLWKMVASFWFPFLPG